MPVAASVGCFSSTTSIVCFAAIYNLNFQV
jgi:hypothetical protein